MLPIYEKSGEEKQELGHNIIRIKKMMKNSLVVIYYMLDWLLYEKGDIYKKTNHLPK